MGKVLALLALVTAAGCGSEPSYGTYMETVTVKVENTGASQATGWAEGWDGESRQDIQVDPGQTVKVTVLLSSYRLKVHLWRSSDGYPLIDDFWGIQNLLDRGDELDLTVSPP